MRILHVLHQYLPDHVGGTEHYTHTLARAQRQAGHQVAVFCRRNGAGRDLDREESEGIVVYRATSGPFTPWRRLRSTLGDQFLANSLKQAMLETQPDLIHIHHLMGLPSGALAAASPGTPLVVTLHDYWWVCANAQLITDYDHQVCDGPRGWANCSHCGLARAGVDAPGPLASLAAPLFAWRAATLGYLKPQVAAWIAPTEFVRNWHIDHGFPSNSIFIVPHGIDLPPVAVWGDCMQNGQGARHFAYIGGLSPQKGVHVLIDAFNELPSSARLTIAGDEAAFPDYCAALHTQATHPGIRFVGQLERDGVWQALFSADVLVVPSLWYETASLVIQEAFAAKTPVIAADHGALRERVQHEVNGLLVPPGDVSTLRDSMLHLMDRPVSMAQLQSGIGPVMSIAEHVHEVESIYHRVLEEGRRKA
jgi:glycosyltransferase involved in cell wall biosynthesis